ncbi:MULTISPECIES: hypothetical protein [unclassified Legionella]|uniref:hypothetical protein n=1 Tax=unclassified Legionella TaxID=2622702 RepID=UPI0010555CD6|nr:MULTISPECIES: hypothetical protein [unclassified Legionella]MDI9819404.1 hypothetical protein [Legionella sp. PL877]
MSSLWDRPILRSFRTSKDINKYFSHEAQEKFFADYRKSVNLDKGLSGTQSFETYNQNRISAMNGFSSLKDDKGNAVLKAPDGTSFADAFKPSTTDSEQIKNSKEAVANALENALKEIPDTPGSAASPAVPGTETKRKEYQKNLEVINNALKKTPPEFDPHKIVGFLHITKAEAVDAIKAQQQHEKTQLAALFKDPEFTNNLTASLGVSTDPAQSKVELEKIRQDMTNALESSHQKNLKAFEDSFNKSLADIHRAAQRERDRITYLAAMYEHNKDMRAAIEREARKHPADPAPSIQYNMDKGKISLRNVKVENLDTIQTITGMKVNYSDGEFSIGSSRIEFLKSFFSRHKRMEYQAQSLAEAVRACGHDSIEMKANHDHDPKKAEEAGRVMYEAAINAGFDPKKITIIVNGKQMSDKYDPKTGEVTTPGELFKGESARYARTQRIASEIKQYNEAVFKPSAQQQSALKQELKGMRESAKPAPAPQPGNTLGNT